MGVDSTPLGCPRYSPWPKGLKLEVRLPFLMAPRVSPCHQHPPALLRLPPAACRLQEESWAVPPANPELMNLRNLLPVNSLFFGVLVRTMGIRAWQAGLLLRGAQFSPQEKSELVPGPPTLVSPLQQSLVLTRGIIYLIPARSGWLLGRRSE